MDSVSTAKNFAAVRERFAGRGVDAEKVLKALGRRAFEEEFRGLPLGAVWDEYCLRSGVPPTSNWRQELSEFEKRPRPKRPEPAVPLP